MLWVCSELRREVTGLLGHSKGGLAAMLYACTYDDVPRVLGLAASSARRSGLQELFGHDGTLDTVARAGRAEVVWRSVKAPGQLHTFYLTREVRAAWRLLYCTCVLHVCHALLLQGPASTGLEHCMRAVHVRLPRRMQAPAQRGWLVGDLT